MTPKSSKTLKPFLSVLSIGDPFGHLNLTLVPLQGRQAQPVDYLLAADAIGAGVLVVTEVSEYGRVPELLAVSSAQQMILLLDGEELVGAKQNRILNTTVLLPAQAQTKIPVSCVEQGRWRHTSQKFGSGSFATSHLRANKSRSVGRNLRQSGQATSDQGEVWQDVAQCIAGSGASSPTGAMHDAMEQRRDLLDAYLSALACPAGACGVIASINGRFAALDMFDKPETLQRVWPRLVRGYALDAICRSRAPGGVFTERGAQGLLEHVGEIECQPCPSAGVGEDWRLESPGVVGQALVVGETCVHLCVFPNDDPDRRVEGGPSIQAPSSRRRHRQ